MERGGGGGKKAMDGSDVGFYMIIIRDVSLIFTLGEPSHSLTI